MSRDSGTVLAPGFRFHPTDEELVSYYLKRRVFGKPFRFDAISDVDVYKSEPWDLPEKSRLKSRDLEWYFFSLLDRKYGNGSRTNRATEKGYWKTTGKDRSIPRGSRTVGMKKTLVYHLGRAPRGERSNWVMHEYKLVGEELESAGVTKDPYVLCRIFRKSGSGPKNGEQYGAPFVEEDWEDAVEALIPGGVDVDERIPVDAASVEVDDPYLDLDTFVLPENDPLPLNFYDDERGISVGDSGDILPNNESLLGSGYLNLEMPDDQMSSDIPAVDENNTCAIKYENFMEQTDGMYPEDVNCLLDLHCNVNPVDAGFLYDEPYVDASDNLPLGDGLFLETNDLSNPVEADSSGADLLGEFLSCLDAEDGDSHDLNQDSAILIGSENLIIRQETLQVEEHMNGPEKVAVESYGLLNAMTNNVEASTSNQNRDDRRLDSDDNYPFIKRAGCMLGSLVAPPIGSEYPSKDLIQQLNSAAQSSGSVRAAACMICVPDMAVSGLGMKWSFDKNGNLNLIISFILPQVDPGLLTKMVPGMPWRLVPVLLSAALVMLSAWYKVSTSMCAW